MSDKATIGVLNVGAGDLELSFDPKNPAERIRAARIVKDMLRRGYALLVNTGKGKYQRVLSFDEKHCKYIIADMDPEVAAVVDAPLTGESLIVEPTYPKAAELMEMCGETEGEKKPNGFEGWKVRSRFHSSAKRCDIYIMEKDGKIRWAYIPAVHALDKILRTLGCSEAWGIEQESKAVNTLGGLIKHHPFKQYLLTGTFLESSERSGLTYMFRRLRPTVVINTKGAECRIMCALCLHPIAYYSGSWAGAMCPTDDVIAHLMLMRGDEPMLWRRANQHPAYRPESGL